MSRRPRPLDVAIVGMACRFPGAGDLFVYWENVLANRPSIGDVPEGRWDASRSALADAGLLDRMPDPRRVFMADSASASAMDAGAKALVEGRADLAIVEGVVLKRLRDAERDGDRVYAVVKGLGLASEARGASRRAYRRSGIDPETVGHFEDGDCGMAGLIKAALCLHHRMLPASAGAVNPVARPWISGSAAPRRAGVNAFGFDRINAHAVLEEHAASADGVTPGAMPRWPTEAILLSAENRAALAGRVRWLADRLRSRPDVNLKDLAATLALESSASDPSSGTSRLGLVVESVDDLIARLDGLAPRLDDPSCKSIRDARGAYFWESPPGREGGLAFLFPGEGSQYPGMLADLCPHFPEVRALFDTSDRLALESGAIEPPSAMLFRGLEDDPTLWEAGTAVNLVLSSQWAIYGLLLKLGLRPSAVAGHSSGEFLALAAAGAFLVDRHMEERFRDLSAVFARLDQSGGIAPARLVGLATSRERVDAAIGGLAGVVTVAVDNCPHQVVIAGPHDEVEVVVARHRERGVMTEDMPFSRPYHTPAFAPALDPLREFFDALDIGPLGVPLYSCCSAGRVADDPEEIRRLGVAQWTNTVEFRRTVEAMRADGLRVFVDVGARGNLAGFVEDTLRGKPAFAVAANLPRRSGLTQLNHLVASLFAQGVPLTPEFLYARRRPSRVDLDGTTLLAAPEAPDDELDAVMLSHLETMNAFLRTQRAVMAGFLAGTEGVDPLEADFGPWAGEVVRLDPGVSVGAVITLDAAGDPVAEHHTFGGRRVSAVDPSMRGLPVLPFTVMAEMLTQLASRLAPGRSLIGLRDVRARRWIRYEDEPVPMEVVAEVAPGCSDEVRAALFNRGKAGLGDAPEVEGIIVFRARREEPPDATILPLGSAENSRFDADMMYAEQWLFHGPALQAVSEVGRIGDEGIDGALRVLPRRGLYRDIDAPRPLTDPIVIDAFTHLLGVWGLDWLPEGDVIFPLRLGRLDIFGDDPPEGADCPCRIRIKSLERFKLSADAEILRPDGRVWMRLTDWEDWRFHWPSRYRDVMRMPEHVLLGEPMELPGLDPREAVAVWLEPPGDMGRPVWRDVLEQIQLSPDERSGPLRPVGDERLRTLRLWGRIAAKDAARRLWLGAGDSPVFPADLSILPGAEGRLVLRSRLDPERGDMPAVSIAYTDGVAVAVASRDPEARVGIAVEKVGDRAESVARVGTAREAVVRAMGIAPSSVEAVASDETGRVEVRLGTGSRSGPFAVHTVRRGDYVLAWFSTAVPGVRLSRMSLPLGVEASGWMDGASRGNPYPQYSEADA